VQGAPRGVPVNGDSGPLRASDQPLAPRKLMMGAELNLSSKSVIGFRGVA
jgi:hypothetical protein